MTLYQISESYREDERQFRLRISMLRERARVSEDNEEADALRRRIAELQILLRQSRELAELTRHYYERSFYRGRKYSL